MFQFICADPCNVEVERKIEEFWQKSVSQAQGPIWDGPIIRVFEVHEDRLVLNWTTYRYYLAARAGIQAGGAFLALGVTAVVCCRDGLVLGRRNEGLASLGGFWECAPAGNAESADPAADIRRELREELGIAPELTDEVRPVGLVLDPAEFIIDCVFSVGVDLGAERIRELHRLHGSDEYSEIAIVPEREIRHFLAAQSGHVLRNVPVILELVGRFN